MTKISHLAFSGCSALREFYYNATDCADIDNVTVLFNNSGDRELGFKLIVGANVKRIPDRMFANNVAFPSTPALTAIEFEDGSLCESIGTYAFKGCVRLESLTLPDSMKSIGMSAFVACVGIKEIKFGKNLSTIGYGAFESCEGLTQLIIPEGVTTIEGAAFRNCTGVKKITASDSVTDIGEYAFAACGNLESVYLGKGMTVISKGMFSNCKKLADIHIPDSVTKIGADAFYNCSSVSDVYYSGTAEQWAAVNKSANVIPSRNAEMHFSVQ